MNSYFILCKIVDIFLYTVKMKYFVENCYKNSKIRAGFDNDL